MTDKKDKCEWCGGSHWITECQCQAMDKTLTMIELVKIENDIKAKTLKEVMAVLDEKIDKCYKDVDEITTEKQIELKLYKINMRTRTIEIFKELKDEIKTRLKVR